MKKATVPNPVRVDEGGRKCKEGFYCPEGTQNEVECPEGTFNDGVLAHDVADCQNVEPGKFSRLTGAVSNHFSSALPNDYGDCTAGHICYGGSSTPTPDGMAAGELCPTGKYCPGGTKTALDCPPGRYSRMRGMGECEECPKGTYCPDTGMSDTEMCEAFHYCPQGSSRQIPCPPGRYSPTTELEEEDDCRLCSAGIACEKPATETDTLQCAAGYVCGEGSSSEMPLDGIFDGVTVMNGRCPTGAHCGKGAGYSTMCAEGEYQDAVGASECKPCLRGYACERSGIKDVSEATKCTAGYFCNGNAITPTPDSSKCSVGYYCEEGATYEMMCEDGKYQPASGMGECDACPAGEICYVQYNSGPDTHSNIQKDCPGFYYCPGGNGPTGKFCEPGTKSTESDIGLKSASECVACATGKYCVDSGKGSPDNCAAGYYCKSGASSPIPNFCPPNTDCSGDPPPYVDPEEAYLCPPGHYCGVGEVQPTQCSAGKFRREPGAMIPKHCTNCLPGQYCVKTSTIPIACPAGSYCPLGSAYYNQCPVGTYNPNTLAMYASNCVLCPPKYFCSDAGVADLNGYECPPSSYCLEGTVTPINCLAGFYIEHSGDSADDCKACSTDFYCPTGASREEYCPDGNECPRQSPAPSACERGYCCYW